ncbi:MAG TPA: PAS domain S-box protein, partial [Lacibacter sp.]|nr:PAS domain S-box protein [Lacibacter sp.]
MSQLTPDLDLQLKLVKRSFILLTIVLVISLLSFVGWIFSVERLKYFISGVVAMNPLTSLCFISLVIALRIKLKYKGHGSKQAIANIITLLIFGIVFSKLIAILVGWDYSLDQLMFANEINNDAVAGFANRMAPNTAFCFVLLATSILFFYKLHSFFLFVAQATSVLALMVAVFSILGYIFGAQEFYEVQDYIPMALNSGICFFLFSLAILFASPGIGIMQQLTSKYSGSYVAWRLFVPAFILPVLIGLFRLWGQRSGMYNLEFGSALFVTSMILFFLSLIWVNTLLLNRREQKSQEIIAEKNYLAALVEQTSDAILSTDPYLNIMSWNKGAEDIYGYKKEDVIGKPLGSFLKSTLEPEASEKLLA